MLKALLREFFEIIEFLKGKKLLFSLFEVFHFKFKIPFLLE